MFTRHPIVLAAALAAATIAAPASAQCPPDRPTGFSASDGSQCNGVSLNWSDVDGRTNYQLWRSRNSDMDNGVVIGNPVASQFLDLTALPGVQYYYRVRAFRAACLPGDNFSPYSSINAGSRGDVPGTPTNLEASDGSGCYAVELTWQGVPGGPLYEVWRNTVNDWGDSNFVGASPIESFTDLTALPGETYYYWVRATAACGDSDPSNVDTGYRGLEPEAPTGLTVSDGLCQRIEVRWDDPGDGSVGEVWRNAENNLDEAIPVGLGVPDSDTDQFVFVDVEPPGLRAYYWVRNRNQCGPGTYSESAVGYEGNYPHDVPNVAATVASRCDGVLITWDQTEEHPPITGYRVFRGSNEDFKEAVVVHELSGSEDSYLDTNAEAGFAYYYWVVASNNCGFGADPFEPANGVVGIPVSITEQPVGQSASPGDAAAFDVEAVGSGLIYQWQRDEAALFDGGNISGATTAHLTIDPVTPDDAGTYTVIVSNSCGSETSDAAELTVGCAADFNGDGNLNVFDFLAYQTAFSDGDPSADFNGDGRLNVFDFLEFQTAYSNGC